MDVGPENTGLSDFPSFDRLRTNGSKWTVASGQELRTFI